MRPQRALVHNELVNICIHGFGNVGSALAKIWVRTGHSIEVCLRPGSKHGSDVSALGLPIVDPREGAQRADVNVLALPWPAVKEVLPALGPLKGKILLDTTNPLDRDLNIIKPPAGSAGLQVAEWAEGASVVKAFNTIGAMLYGRETFDGFYCGDDADALEAARQLITDTKMKPVFAGPLRNSGYLEHIAGLWIDFAIHRRVNPAFGFNMVTAEV
ncbi:MAG: NADPH-dependent F420 reductase [Bryobacteraceae bacterium]